MSKLLLFSDIHVHSHKNSLKRLQHCLEALEWVFKTALSRDIKNVVFLGDLFQDRERIQVLPYQRTYEIINKYCSGKNALNLHLLIGNHDMWFADKTDISSVYPLGSIDGVRIIKRCETINIDGLDIDFLPFTLNPLKSIEQFVGSMSPVLCGHISLDGAQLNTFYKTSSDISVEYEGDMVKVDADQFSPWQKVFLGHYHGEQRIKHVEYIGSPLQLNFAEAFQQKHIIILDTKTLEQEYIVNQFSPKHLILSEDDLKNYDLNNAFVKLIPNNTNAADLAELKNQLTKENDILTLEFASAKPETDTETKINIENAQELMTTDRFEMLMQYMKSVDISDELDFDHLFEIGKLICQKSQVE